MWNCAGKHVSIKQHNQTHQRQQAAEQNVYGIVAGHRGRKASLGELALAGAGDPDEGEGAESSQSVNRGRAAGVEKACAERKVDAQLRQPSADPDPMGKDGKDEGGENGGDCAAGGEAQAVSSRSPGDEGDESDGEKFKQ